MDLTMSSTRLQNFFCKCNYIVFLCIYFHFCGCIRHIMNVQVMGQLSEAVSLLSKVVSRFANLVEKRFILHWKKITVIKLALHQRYAIIITIYHTWNDIIEHLCISKGKNYMNVSIYSNRSILLCTWNGLFRFYHTAVGHFV